MMRGSVTLRRVALELWERGRWWQYESGLGEHQQLPDLGLMQSVVLIALEKKKGRNYVGSENTPYINGGKGNTLAQRVVSLPHQRVKGKLVWVWWVSGSMQFQCTRVMMSIVDVNGTYGKGQQNKWGCLRLSGFSLQCSRQYYSASPMCGRKA
eukprot:1161179-Pelagomonas_calceolata.AAC.4